MYSYLSAKGIIIMLLPQVPLEYDLLKEFPPCTLRNRLVLLHHFSDLFCPCLAMFSLGFRGGSGGGGTSDSAAGRSPMDIDQLRSLLVSAAKESAFRKVVQATMVRDRQHGPVIELNRISAAKARAAKKPQQQQQQQQQQQREQQLDGNSNEAAATVSSRRLTVFEQMVAKAQVLGPECLLLPHRAWKVKFVGK